MLTHETQTASLLIPLIIAVGLALVARLLYKPRDQQVLKDNKPNTATQRGSFIPLVEGCRRVGAVVLWVGDRHTTVEEEEVGGKGGGGGASVEKTIYYEKGIHALCVGPAAKIKGIYVDGVLIPNSGDINSLFYPSGTSITFPEYGTCRVYWGELDQPTSSLLTEKIGIATAAPYVVRVEWDDFRLGGTPRWKIIEYVVDVPPMVSGPIATPSHANGVNPAWILWKLLTAKYPHGAGLPSDWLDYDALASLGAIAASEGVFCNLLVQDGESIDRIVGELMQDLGFMLPECPTGVITPLAIRKVSGSVQELSNDLLLPPIEEIEKVHLATLGDALVYEYSDKDQGFRTATIDVDDDSLGAVRNRRVKKVSLATVTVRDVASIVAQRRQIEDLADTVAIKVKALRGLRAAVPGETFDLPGIGRVRLISVQLDWDEPTVTLELMVDPFNVDPISYVDPGLPGSVVSGDLEPDIRFEVFEMPRAANPSGDNALILFRHRANQSIFGANVLISNDGTTYTTAALQNVPCAGGVLAADWAPISWGAETEYGPTVLIDDNGDETLPSNLSGDLTAWLTGSQLMLIGSGPDAELFYVREWEVVTPGTSYRPRGLIRGRLGAGFRPIHWNVGNFREASAGEPCFIISSASLSVITGPLISTGGANYVKSQPFNNLGTLPAAAVLPDTLTQVSPMTRPMPLAWVTGGGSFPVPRHDLTWAYDAVEDVSGANVTEDVTFTFIPSTTDGAGLQGFGQAVAVSTPTGNLIVEIYYDIFNPGIPFEDLPLVKTYSVALASLAVGDGTYRWVYDRADMEQDALDAGQFFADFTDYASGSVLSWKFLLYHEVAGVRSAPVEVRLHELEVFPHQYIPRAENH